MYTPDPEHVWLPGVICAASGDGKQLTVRLDEVVGPRDEAALERIESERELKALAGSQRAVDLTDSALLEALNAKNTSVESGTTSRRCRCRTRARAPTMASRT